MRFVLVTAKVSNSNSIPNSGAKNPSSKLARTVEIALPFISLCLPAEKSISVYASCTNMLENRSIYQLSKSALSMAATLSNWRAGTYVFAALEIAESGKKSATYFYQGEMKKGSAELATTLGNTLYLSFLATGSQYFLFASLLHQAAMTTFAAYSEWEEGNTPEALAKLAIALIRIKQIEQIYSQLPAQSVAPKTSNSELLLEIANIDEQELGDYLQMKEIFQNLPSPPSDIKLKNSMVRALERNSPGEVRAILEWGFPSKNYDYVRTAIRKGQDKIVKILFESGFNVDDGLLDAIVLRQEKIAEFFIDQGSDIHRKWVNYKTPIDLAAERGLWKIVDRLFELGCTADGEFHLKRALKKRSIQDLREILTHLNVSIKAATKVTLNVIQMDWAEGLKELLDYGVDPNAVHTPHWYSFLGYAINYGKATPLHSFFADADSGGPAREYIPLNTIIQILLEAGAKFERGVSLHVPAYHGLLDLIKLLTEYGADVNQKGNGLAELVTWTPIDSAVEGGHRDVVQWLLKNGAKPTEGAIKMAFARGYNFIAEILIDY